MSYPRKFPSSNGEIGVTKVCLLETSEYVIRCGGPNYALIFAHEVKR
jgi:hypothetical protein